MGHFPNEQHAIVNQSFAAVVTYNKIIFLA